MELARETNSQYCGCGGFTTAGDDPDGTGVVIPRPRATTRGRTALILSTYLTSSNDPTRGRSASQLQPLARPPRGFPIDRPARRQLRATVAFPHPTAARPTHAASTTRARVPHPAPRPRSGPPSASPPQRSHSGQGARRRGPGALLAGASLSRPARWTRRCRRRRSAPLAPRRARTPSPRRPRRTRLPMAASRAPVGDLPLRVRARRVSRRSPSGASSTSAGTRTGARTRSCRCAFSLLGFLRRDHRADGESTQSTSTPRRARSSARRA